MFYSTYFEWIYFNELTIGVCVLFVDIDIPFGYFRNEIYRNFIQRNKPIEELFAPYIGM